MAVRSLWRLYRRNFNTTPSFNVLYFGKGTRKKLNEESKAMVQAMEKDVNAVFSLAEQSSEDIDRQKGRETVEDAIFIYLQRQGKTRRGHVEFIISALPKLNDYNVQRDLSVYKSLFRIFPEGKMVARGGWQADLMHFPKQQDCGMSILIKMEEEGVIPDDEMGRMILTTFGMESLVMARYQRMMYWMPKMRHINPWPVPYWLPKDERKLATLALDRMKIDPLTEVTVHETKLMPGVSIDTFIASSQCPDQRELLARHDKSKPLYVEGPITSWFREKEMSHFLLRADPDVTYLEKWRKYKKYLDETKYEASKFKWFNFIERDEVTEMRPPTVHEQDDGVIMAVAVVGENSMDALRAWLKALALDNPALRDISIVFNVDLPTSQNERLESETTKMRSLPST